MPGRGDEALLRADVPGIHVLALVAITPHVADAHAGYSLKNVDHRDVGAASHLDIIILASSPSFG